MRASRPIKIRGLFFLTPSMIISAASFGVITVMVKALDRLHAAHIVSDATSGTRVAHDVGGDAAGMYDRQPHGAVRHLQFVAQAF